MRKLLIDTASQVFPFLANLIERLVLTAILLRAWGLDGFEYWSLAIAFAGVFILFDAGCQLTFGNGMTEAVVKGDEPRAVAIYRQSNAVFALLGTLATLGVAAVAFSADLQRLLGLDPGRFAPESSQILFALGASSGLKLCLSNLFAVYRVQRAVARGTALIALAELGRLGALALVVIAGGSLALAAWTNLVLILAGLGAIAMFDISRRWPAFRFAWARPWGGALSGSWLTCLLFLLPTIPAIAVNQVPVLILGGVAGLGAGLVGQFVLLRTLANFVRKTLYLALNIVAMDVARHGMASGEARARRLMAPVNVVAGVAAGVCGGAVLAYGRPFMALWSSRGDIYDSLVLALMLAPMIVTPTFIFAQSYLQLRNRPRVWTIGTFAHVALALVLFAVLGDVPVVLRLTIAIFVGEIVGLALPVIWATAGHSLRAAGRELVLAGGLSLVSCGLVLLAAAMLSRAVAPNGVAGLAVHGALMGGVFGGLLLVVTRVQMGRARRLVAAEATA